MVLDTVHTCVEICFYIATAAAAWVGVSAWKKQTKGTAEYELAKKVLIGSYRLRNAIETARNPFMTSSEFADRPVSANETAEQKNVMNHYYAYSQRFNRVQDERALLYPCLIETEAIFGNKVSETIRKLFISAVKLKTAIEMYFQNEYRNGPSHSNSDVFQKQYNILYGLSKKAFPENSEDYDDDGFQEELDSSLEKIEKAFSPYISQFHTPAKVAPHKGQN